jgi:hypothetical protein
MQNSDVNQLEMMDIPLFPLRMTLYPQGLLPLRIFEVRYLDMIKHCFKEKKPFGVVTLLAGDEVRKPDEEISFSKFGTLAKIIDFDAVSPSMFAIACEGTQRFQVLESERQKNGLWLAKVQILSEDENLRVPQELMMAADTLEAFFKKFVAQGISPEQYPMTNPWRLDECGWVANRWCEMLPLPPEQKVHLLAMDNPRLRLDLVCEILEELGISKDEGSMKG